MRLDKFLANSGFSARRDIKKFLKAHAVTVNSDRATQLGHRIDPEHDVILVDGERIRKKEHLYVALNKPVGYISTTIDYFGRESVVDLINTEEKIYPVGRLDKDTHGLILLTDDGALTHKLIHPKYHVEKTYLLTVAEEPREEQLRALRDGVLLRDGITLPADVSVVSPGNGQTVLKMVLREGKNRQIRRMCHTVGLTLLDLQRIQFGPVKLGALREGEYRPLSENEIQQLRKTTER